MIKVQELTDPTSCINKARDNELLFVLLARDKAAPAAIRAWIDERVRLGMNKSSDAQICEAQLCALRMEMDSKQPDESQPENI